MSFRRWFSSWLGPLALALSGLASGGCVTSHMAATRIVTAPNHYDSYGYKKLNRVMWSLFTANPGFAGLTNQFQFLTIPVGPPDATLSTLIVPPRDYHVQIWTQLVTNKPGKFTLNLALVSRTNALPLFTPPEVPSTIFLLHGYLLSKESLLPWAFVLAQAGYRVVLLDFRGHGESTGDTVSFGKYESSDLRQVLDYLLARGLCDTNVGVFGYSYGATMALHWAARDSRVRTVVAVAPYNHPDEAFLRLMHELNVPISQKSANKAVNLAAAHLDLNWPDWSGEASIRKVGVPVLIVSGGRDDMCRPSDVAALQKAAGGVTANVVVPRATHEVVPIWFGELSDPVKYWFKRYLKPSNRLP